MEVFGILIALGLVGLVLGLPIVALVRASSAGRKAEQSRESERKLAERVLVLENQLQKVEGRVKAQTIVLDEALRELRRASTGREGPAPATPAPPEPPKPPTVAVGTEAPSIEPPRPAASVTPTLPPLKVSPPPVVRAKPDSPTPAAKPGAPPVSTAPSALLPIENPPALATVPPTAGQSASVPPIAPPRLEMLGAHKPPSQATARRALNMEEVLGTDWLNKLGMISVVISVALFLAYEMHALGPAGKVLVGFAVGGVFLGAGIFFERREQWRVLARAAMGGGWALLYFTTYAMNHIGAARILGSEPWDFVLLVIVAAAMVAHTLRYQSRAVTGLAFLLAFSTINISHAPATSLIASAILVVALVVIVVKRRWFDLEVLAIVAVFLNHFFWLRPIIEAMGGHRHHFPEFIPSAALLFFYWLVFRISYLLRRGLSEGEEKVSTFAALLNTFLLLAVMKYQSVHPEWAFRCLLALGAIEFVLGQLPIARRRRAAFVVLSVLGATLMVAAIPFKYSGETLPIMWLAEAEALFLAGVFLDEIIFCRLGLLASLLVAFQLDRFALNQIYDLQWKGFRPGELIRGILEFSTTTLIFYGDVHWLARRFPALTKSRFDTVLLRVLSYAAGITAVIGIWWLAPEPWVAVGFAALGLLLMVLGSRTSIREFVYQGHGVAILAFLRVLAVNFGAPNPHLLVRVVTVVLTSTMLYASARWSGLPRTAAVRYVSSWHTWTATLLVATLAWYELKPLSVALAWTLLGLALFEIGRARRLPQLRLQAYLAFASSFLRLFFVNFNAAGVPGQLSPRFYTTVPLALAFFYVYGVLDASGKVEEPQGRTAGAALLPIEVFAPERRWKAAELLCFMGTFTLAGWARFELEADWVVAAWAAMVWALVAIAWRYEKRTFLHQALLLGMAVLMRGTLHNFYQRSYFPAPTLQGRSITVGVTVALLFAVLPFAFKLRRSPEDDSSKRGLWGRVFNLFERRPDQVFFFIPFFLLTVLLALEVPKGMVTVAWGVEAVAVFLLALAVGQRSYRLCGLGLLLLCVGKIVVIDVWGLQLRDKILTFFVLGAALWGVSFLYTRFRETIRQYL
ncbi:MAG: DUF2339 domain-containing protein [Terriglobia bacterium]